MSADTSAAEFCERNITDLSVTEFSFGGYLRALRTAKGVSIRELHLCMDFSL